MIVLGVTGGIGMGKSTVAAQLRHMGAKVLDSDRVVHALLAPGGKAVAPIAARFPAAVTNGAVDRRELGRQVFHHRESLLALEAILHPLVVVEQQRFRARMARLGARIVALDIPLLFETGAEARCDATLVASAPAFLQRQRVLRREGMTDQKLVAIMERQMPDRHKRRLADATITTGLGRAHSYRQLRAFLHGHWYA
jgi:dephospho-CoA kinase